MLFLRVHYPLWCWPSDCSIKINISVSVPRIRYYLLFIENRRSNKIFPARAFLNTLQENPLVMKAQFLSLFAFKTSLPAIVPSNLHSPVAQLVANLTWKKKLCYKTFSFKLKNECICTQLIFTVDLYFIMSIIKVSWNFSIQVNFPEG